MAPKVRESRLRAAEALPSGAASGRRSGARGGGASVFCLRDYHAENLIWLPERQGLARVGLLDFQDAVRAHPAWDLSMLLHDARRDVSPELEAAVLERYLAARPELDRRPSWPTIGSSARSTSSASSASSPGWSFADGKPRYRAFMPRLWRYLDRCLQPGRRRAWRAWLARHMARRARAMMTGRKVAMVHGRGARHADAAADRRPAQGPGRGRRAGR